MVKLTEKQGNIIKSVDVTGLICERVSNGESLRSICRDDDMPHIGSFLRWVAEDDVLREQYARAMEVRADLIFDEMADIADDATNDFMDKVTADGMHVDKALNAEHIQRSRLRIDTRKWILSRMNPKKYGDNSKLQISGDAENPLIVKTARDFNDDELAAIAAGSGTRAAE